MKTEAKVKWKHDLLEGDFVQTRDGFFKENPCGPDGHCCLAVLATQIGTLPEALNDVEDDGEGLIRRDVSSSEFGLPYEVQQIFAALNDGAYVNQSPIVYARTAYQRGLIGDETLAAVITVATEMGPAGATYEQIASVVDTL